MPVTPVALLAASAGAALTDSDPPETDEVPGPAAELDWLPGEADTLEPPVALPDEALPDEAGALEPPPRFSTGAGWSGSAELPGAGSSIHDTVLPSL